jgi:hypothetical protein
MKKIAVIFMIATAICTLNISIISKRNVPKSHLVLLNKALADGESCIPDLPIPGDPGPDIPYPGYPGFPNQD